MEPVKSKKLLSRAVLVFTPQLEGLLGFRTHVSSFSRSRLDSMLRLGTSEGHTADPMNRVLPQKNTFSPSVE
jgi:hypothetical protein